MGSSNSNSSNNDGTLADSSRQWHKELGLTEREVKEIEFSLTYARNFAHGTTGHNGLMLLAKLAGFLNHLELTKAQAALTVGETGEKQQ